MGSGLCRVEDDGSGTKYKEGGQISGDLHHFLGSSNVFFNSKVIYFD